MNVMPYLGKISVLGLRVIKCQKLGFLEIFSETGHKKFLIFCLMVEGNRGYHLNVMPYLGKILIRGLRGIKCQKFRFLDIFSETGHYKFLIFCMMVECNRGHHLSVVPYLKKILIWGLRGLSVKNSGFWTFFRKPVIKSFLFFA